MRTLKHEQPGTVSYAIFPTLYDDSHSALLFVHILTDKCRAMDQSVVSEVDLRA